MRKTLSLDEVVRREIKQPTLLENATLVLDFVDDLVEAFRGGIVTTYVQTFDQSVRRRPLTPTLMQSDFWLHHQIDTPEYMVTGRGIITDRYWLNSPSYNDILIDAIQAKRWLFRRRMARLFVRVFKLSEMPTKASSAEIKAAISRAVDDHIKGVTAKPEDVFVKTERTEP